MRKRGAVLLRDAARGILTDGLILAAAFTVVVVASLRIDACLWIADYPPDVRAASPACEAPTVLRVGTAVLLAGVLLGGVVYSNRRMALMAGAARAGSVFLRTMVLFWMVNVADVVIVDWLFFVTWQPAFVIIPGTEGLAGYRDYGYHLRESALSWGPWVGSLVLAGLLALVFPPLWARRRPVMS